MLPQVAPLILHSQTTFCYAGIILNHFWVKIWPEYFGRTHLDISLSPSATSAIDSVLQNHIVNTWQACHNPFIYSLNYQLQYHLRQGLLVYCFQRSVYLMFKRWGWKTESIITLIWEFSMAETKTERKVTVILATDVVGYSTKMEENEDQTLKNLKACRSIIDGLV